MRLSIVITILAGLMFLSACSDPASDKSKAVTGEAAPVTSPAAAARGQKYVITPQNSQIAFVGSKVTGSHNGSFGDFSGQLTARARTSCPRNVPRWCPSAAKRRTDLPSESATT